MHDLDPSKVAFSRCHQNHYQILVCKNIREIANEDKIGPHVKRLVNLYELSRQHMLTTFLGPSDADAKVGSLLSLSLPFLQDGAISCLTCLVSS